jgi:hypothetical protein
VPPAPNQESRRLRTEPARVAAGPPGRMMVREGAVPPAPQMKMPLIFVYVGDKCVK